MGIQKPPDRYKRRNIASLALNRLDIQGDGLLKVAHYGPEPPLLIPRGTELPLEAACVCRGRLVRLSPWIPALLAVHDNGCGFGAHLQTRRPSLGHWSMRERIRSLGGTLKSAHGAGTTVAAWVPSRKAAP
jgi:hypothetical protein